MPRCYLTGVEITLDDAFVLDLTAAHRTLRELKEKVATLERLAAQLGATDQVPVPNRGGAGTFHRKDRRLVSGSVALALAAVCPERELFLSWTAWRARGRALPLLALHHHPDYGARVRELSIDEADKVVALSRAVLGQLGLAEELDHDVRDALVAGVCLALRGRGPEEVATVLRERLAAGESFADLGIPAHVQGKFTVALGAGAAQGRGTPRVEPGPEPMEPAHLGTLQGSE